MTEEEGKRNLDRKEEPSLWETGKGDAVKHSGNTKGKMGAARSFESFDFSKIMNGLF